MTQKELFELSSLVELVSYRARNQPEQTTYVFLQRGREVASLTYRELEQQAQVIAAHLQTLGAFGKQALLLYPPGLEYITAFFGCLYAGVIAVPAYPPRRNQKLLRLSAIVTDAQATVALTTNSILANMESQFNQSPELAAMDWLVTDTLDLHLNETWQNPEVNRDTCAFLQYTSGSTGNPKGVMVSHGNLLHNSALIQQAFENTSASRGVSWLPPYHDMGLVGGILQPLYVGAVTTLLSPVDFLQKPLRWLQAISDYKATTSGGPDFAYDLCVRKVTPEDLSNLDLSSWEVAFTGAEPIHAETLEAFAQTFAPCGFRKEAFYPCYGMAEATLIISGGKKEDSPVLKQVKETEIQRNEVVSATEQENGKTLVGCGGSLSQHKIIIVNPQNKTLCPAEQVGEIWVSGPSIAQGYWNQAEKTKQTFNAYLTDTGEGPFLRTGDLGFLQDGELFVTGRIKDIIIIHGQNHYPQDIELTVQNSHPALRPYCGAAFTVEVKGKERLVIVQELEKSYLRKLNFKEEVEIIRQEVTAQHNLPVYAVVLIKTASIPKTSSGKVQRYACRSKFLTGSLEVVGDWSENPREKAKFMYLQSEVDSVLQKLQTYSCQRQ